jgi:transposase
MRHPTSITLTAEERVQVETVITRGKEKARIITRARILLKSADGWSITQMVQALDVSAATVSNVRHRYAQGGVASVLQDKVQAHRRSALSGLETAHLLAVASTPAPNGHNHWTVRLLAAKAVDLGYVEHISLRTIHRLLKKTS